MNKEQVISILGSPEKTEWKGVQEVWWYNIRFPSPVFLLNPLYWISGLIHSEGYKDREEIYWKDDSVTKMKEVKYYLGFY